MRILVEYNPEEISVGLSLWLEENITHELQGVSSTEKQYYIDSLLCEENLEKNCAAEEYQYLLSLQEEGVDYLAIDLEN